MTSSLVRPLLDRCYGNRRELQLFLDEDRRNERSNKKPRWPVGASVEKLFAGLFGGKLLVLTP
jgi:hypothetical protein